MMRLSPKTALAAVLLGLSCGPTGLLSDLETQSDQWSRPLEPPTINGAPGPYRNPADVPAVQITAPTTGDAVFYTLDGTYPQFSAGGTTRSSTTQRFEGAPMLWPAGGLVTGYGVTRLRAVSWQSGGRRSAEANRDFRVLGTGGLVWAQPALGTVRGETRAVAVASDGTVYTAGTTVQGGETVGFVAHTSAAGALLAQVFLDHASQINALTLDATGQVLVAGSLDGIGSHGLLLASATTTQNPQGFYAGLSSDLLTSTYLKVLSVRSRLRALALSGTTVLTAGVVYDPGNLSLDGLYVSGLRGGSNALAFGFTASTGAALPGYLSGSGDVKDEFTSLAVSGGSAVAAGWVIKITTSVNYGAHPVDAPTVGTVPLAVGFQPSAWSVDFAWPASAPGWGGGSEARAVAIDASGNTLVGGVVQGGSFVESHTGPWSGNNAFLVSLNNSGIPQWVGGPTIGSGAAESEVNGLARSAGGDLLAVGSVGPATLWWGSLTVGGSAPRTPFVAWIPAGSSDPTTPGQIWQGQNGGDQTRFLAVVPQGTLGAGWLYMGGATVGGSVLDWGQGSSVTFPGTGTLPYLSQHFF